MALAACRAARQVETDLLQSPPARRERIRIVSRWNTVAIFGVGLIGGSIGIGLRRRGFAEQVIGIGRNQTRLEVAVSHHAITRGTTDVAQGVRDADLVVVCTPVQRIAAHVAQVSEYCDPGTVITDAGSTKERLVAEIGRREPQVNFVGSHPMTGSDKSGVEFCDADLFVDRVVIVTPTEQTPPASIDAVTMFWQSLEARVISMSPADHDRAVAAASHVPHVLSSVLAATTPAGFLPLVAGGWLDMTRVAAADTLLWTQILQENKANVAAALTQFRAQLQRFETDLVNEDHDSITRQLAAGKQRRDAVGN